MLDSTKHTTPSTMLKSLDELERVAAEHHASGETVVLAHGTFDLLHIGHVRHLREAKRLGSVLFVTITADAFVNKGPGRPVFSEHMRAEMLCSLDFVDFVGVVHEGTAIPAINAVKPHIYVKGQDYRDAKEDITGGIVRERNAVESHGGLVTFTDEATFSSSSLINRHLAVFDPTLDEFLESQRSKGALDGLNKLIDKIRNFRVLFIGDAIIDDYNYVSSMGKSPKENIIATQFGEREVFAGGVLAAAKHVAEFCRNVEIVTLIGENCEYQEMLRSSMPANVTLHAFERPGMPTTRKSRYIDKGYLRKLFEVYYMDDTPMTTAQKREIDRIIVERADEFDLVVVTDFGHGLLTPSMIATLQRHARFLAVNAQSNSANMGYNLITKYDRADYICIDAPEARLAVSDRTSDIEYVASKLLPSRIDCPRIVVTHGKNGCVGYERDEGTVHVPAFTKTVVDTVGAGDAFFAVTAPLAAAGGRMDQLTFVGNAAGAIKVGIVGHRQSVEKVPLLKFLTTLLK
jgi:rfaE bifunctional protein kinase chain/domain/rfaE bifunctional protein nucleotidyltransferase chain/domain